RRDSLERRGKAPVPRWPWPRRTDGRVCEHVRRELSASAASRPNLCYSAAMPEAPVTRLAAAIETLVRAHKTAAPAPRGLAYLGLEGPCGRYPRLDAGHCGRASGRARAPRLRRGRAARPYRRGPRALRPGPRSPRPPPRPPAARPALRPARARARSPRRGARRGRAARRADRRAAALRGSASARRPSQMPVRRALVRVARGQHLRLGERPPDELEPDWPPVACESAGQRERRQPGQVERTREPADRLERAHLGVADT